jgi:hypothetical protein
MSDAELHALAAEFTSTDEPSIDAPEVEGLAPDDRQEESTAAFDQAAMVQVCSVLVSAIGGVICSRADVAALTEQETAAVGGALANVAAQYDLTMSPKTAAWLGLAVVVAGVALPRQKEIEARKKIQPAPKEPEPAPADPPVRSVADIQAEIDARAEAA